MPRVLLREHLKTSCRDFCALIAFETLDSHEEQDMPHEYDADADVRVLLRRLWRAIQEYVVEDISLIDYLDRALQKYRSLLDYSNCEYLHPLNLYFDMWEIAHAMRVGGPLKIKLEELFDL